MENPVKGRLEAIQFGELQQYKGVTIVPLVTKVEGQFRYSTLSEGLARSDVEITEVSTGGSVPELLVANRGDQPVLLIDGEELAGAKQNRVLNTSILLKAHSETKIPVSCTEQGRWSYVSAAFCESGNIMAHYSRSRKSSSVYAHLQSMGLHSSDQAEVWESIAELHAKAGSHSPTSAMSDAFKAREEDLRQCEQIFKPVNNQVGLLAFIGGNVAGMDLLSLSSAYARLHPKLVRSYSLEGMLGSAQEAVSQDKISSAAREFVDQIMRLEADQFQSVGHGSDLRFKGEKLTGTALVHENEVIHAAFFRLEESGRGDRLASFLQRRRSHSRG